MLLYRNLTLVKIISLSASKRAGFIVVLIAAVQESQSVKVSKGQKLHPYQIEHKKLCIIGTFIE